MICFLKFKYWITATNINYVSKPILGGVTVETEITIMDKMCSDRCKSTCEINQQLSFKIQSPQNLETLKSLNFAFMPYYTDPDMSSFKSYSGDLLIKDTNGWKFQLSGGKELFRTDVTGFPLGIQSWSSITGLGIVVFIEIYCQNWQTPQISLILLVRKCYVDLCFLFSTAKY